MRARGGVGDGARVSRDAAGFLAAAAAKAARGRGELILQRGLQVHCAYHCCRVSSLRNLSSFLGNALICSSS